ncbi:[NiFe] hydrogenase nickel incorporation protein HypA [Helicobacter ailurogastricus]|nr:[NiFe] hydrogenase nickel incorporation protein HypA [Helicobacter ailurogastricus]
MHAKKHNATKIERVVVSIGERAGMDKHLFVSAFETFKGELDICKEAVLEIVDEKVELECLDCAKTCIPPNLEYGVCAHCGSQKVRIVKGTQMQLLSLEMV